ncbi:TPA: M20/M25/M40 family metallo-hydrolase, partial [Candidatus Micrarchaeota archaeon]|nr:M20/M25/M40 family metallo-hydrolase [Candidatus Micrarchaeota archaeon]
DEEVGGVNGALALREMLKSAGLLPDYVINGDGFGLAPIVRRRNAFVVTIRIPRKPVSVKGKLRVKRVEASIREKESRHAAYFMPGVDTHPMIALAEHLLYHPDTYVVSIRGAWVKENVVPSWVEAVLVDAGEDAGEDVSADLNLTRLIRSLIPLTRAAIDTEMHSDFGVTITPNLYEATDDAHVLKLDVRAMVSERSKVESQLSDVLMEVLDDADVNVEGGSGYLYTPSDARIVAEAAKVLDELGLPVRFIEACGASDSRFFSPLGVDCIDFGPLGGNVHGPNEYVIVDSLKHAYEFYARLIRRLSGKGRRGA